MPAAIPLDQDSQVTLSGARAEAQQALNQFRSEYKPSGPPSGAVPAPGPGTLPTEGAPPPTQEALEGNEGIIPGIPSAPDPAPKVLDKNTEDNGEVSVSSAMHFLRDSFKGTGTEVANAVPRALSRLGGWLTNAAAGGVFAADLATHGGSDKGHWADHVFNFKKEFIDPAVEHWTPPRAPQTGEGDGSGGGAQAVGNAAEMVPGIVTGGAGLLAQILSGSTDSAMNDIDQGKSIKQAVADGTIDGLSTWLMSKFGISPSSSILRRVIQSAGAGAIVQMGANVLKAGVNKAFGDPNAPPPDLFQGVDEATVIGGLFGVKGHSTISDKRAPNLGNIGPQPTPKAGSTPKGNAPAQPTAGTNAPSPPPPTVEAVAAAPVAPVPAGTVPDKPSVEPLKDIKAQFADMNNKLTPRQGVLVTPDTQTHLTTLGDKTVEQAKKQGRTIDLPQGTLVLKTKGDVIKVNNRIKSGEDPQAIIGSVTGAGLGKTPDATAVVQGRDQSGAVATETTVHPNDVPLAKQKVEDQGYTPVVTSAEEAVARRVDERNKEVSGQTGEVQAKPVEAQPAAREPVTPTEALPEHESNETPAEPPPPRMGLFKTGVGKEVAVHIEEGAPKGQLRIRPIDSKTGEPADRTIDVPAERVRESASSQTPVAADSESREALAGSQSVETKPVPSEAPSEKNVQQSEAPRNETPVRLEGQKGLAESQEDTSARKPQSALEALPEALATHVKQETPDFERKHAASLAERQDNASSFAAVLGKAAEESHGKSDEAVVNRAANAAKSALGLTLKSKNATDKGQGTSHTRVTALVDEMHRAARELLGTATEEDKKPAVAPKAAALKRRLEQRKAAGSDNPEEISRTAAKAVADEAARAATRPDFTKYPKTGFPEKGEGKAKKVGKGQEGLSVADKTRTNKLAQELIHADFDEYPAAHEKMLKHLHALADANADFPRDQIDQYMHFLMDQRKAATEGHTGRMSDTLEPEEHEFEEPEEGFSRTYRPIIEEGPGARARAVAARHRLTMEWQGTVDKLQSSGFFDSLDKFRNTGEPLGSHFLLDKIIEHTDTPILRTLLTNIRSRVPDSPVYNRDSIIHMKTGAPIGAGKASGVYHLGTNTIQFNFVPEEGFRPFQIKGLVHEMVHAGTLSELSLNPHGELAMKMENALDVLRKRLANKYGEDAISKWTSYFQDRTGSVKRPEGESMRHLYGITNAHELATEILTNPDFIREVAESEDFASPRENLAPGKEGLLTRIFRAIGEFFGIKDAKLLQHIVDTTFETMEANKRARPGIYGKRYETFHEQLSPEIHAALEGRPLDEAMLTHALQIIEDPAPPIHGASNRISELDEGSGLEPTAREFVHVFKSRAADTLRKSVIALKTVGQLYRDHMKDFGHEDATNPLRSLQEADVRKEGIIHKLREISAPVAQKWMRLSREDDTAVSQLMIDTTMYKLDPRVPLDQQSLSAKSSKGSEARWNEFKSRYDRLSEPAREVYNEATEANRKLMRAQRRAGVDTAIAALDANLTDAQRGLLYGAKTPKVYDTLIGKGKLIDIGDGNDKLKSALSDFAGFTEMEGPYHHLGRQGDYVVQAEPEGSREFDTRAAADEFAKTVSGLSPGSRAKVAERGGKFAVDFKAQYVSMHETRREAEREQARLDKSGLNPGKVTQKTLGNAYGALSHGMQELVTEAERKIQANGADEGTRALVDSLRSAFLQMTAARSAYAGSRLARKNFGGVKASDMRRNFAEHALSAGWHTAQMQTAFERAEAMAKMRTMTRDAHGDASQGTMYRRGQLVDALNKHTANEVSTFGQKAPFNAMLAKLGFMSYLASPSHAAIWMTQNFTTGIPVAGARWGYGKAISSFGRAMAAVTSPSIRAQMKAAMGRTATSEEVHQILLDAIAKHPTLGKWATGSNSHLRQLFDRGVISHSYADELGAMAEGPSNVGRFVHGYDNTVERVFGWARVLPAMADSINRLSTALAGLEMTGGDIRKTSDFVQEIHADYSAGNKPLAFKKLSKIPGANSITMFKTYVQEMAHLLYSNLAGTFHGDNKAEAAKTLAGLVVGNALFAGVASAIGIEPLRLALYAYHKVADEEGDVWDFRNAVHRFLNDHFGKTAGNLLAGGPLTRVFNVDVSQRMGLSDLFFHDPPDLLTTDMGVWNQFAMDQLGPMPQELAGNVTKFYGKAQRGDIGGAVSSIIPIKQWQDAAKALQLMETGKTDSVGGQLTQPSGVDAITQLIGFKPTSVADAQEKQGVKVEYAIAARTARNNIVKQIVTANTAGEKAAAWGRYNRWNRNNPTVPVMPKDIARAMKQQERTTEGLPDRNEKANEATDF
jgi:hypothetical protein